ncbi:hypothetical protein BGV40_05265 [Methanosarcina sp. Ant1]|nr:hypothetical protein BGV40_05265 [Methanosarcina sp. Ant1]
MNTKEAFDQSDIDRLVASAESDTIESKVENLEQEVAEIKGSIKALLMDIRETMSVLENPFQDIQGIANISSAIINTTSKPTESDNFEDYRNEEEANLRKVEANLHAEKIKESESDDIDMELIEPTPKRPLEDLKQAAKMLPKIPDSKLIDPMSFYKTIVWSKDMVEKYDYETIKELVEIFYLLGYIQSDVKEIVLKLTEMLDKSNDLDNAVMDLYRLYHILHPEDLSLDSKVLDYVLNENDTVKNLWQRK